MQKCSSQKRGYSDITFPTSCSERHGVGRGVLGGCPHPSVLRLRRSPALLGAPGRMTYRNGHGSQVRTWIRSSAAATQLGVRGGGSGECSQSALLDPCPRSPPASPPSSRHLDGFAGVEPPVRAWGAAPFTLRPGHHRVPVGTCCPGRACWTGIPWDSLVFSS